jgi:type IV secretion system protein VirB10
LLVLIAVLAAVGAAGFATKSAYGSFMAEREEKQRIEREKTADTGRKGKTFAVDAPQPAASAPTALPANFGQPKAGPAADPIPLVTHPTNIASLSGAPAPAVPPPPARKPSMMLPEEEPPATAKSAPPAAVPSLATASAASPGTSQGRGNVQDFAKEQALKSPPTSTNQSSAAKLGDRSMLLARGAYVPCVLETDLISNVPGPTSCIVTSNVYSDDGRVVLIAKGARVLGEYRNTLKPGDSRIAVLWNRVRTPSGIVVDVDSPAADGTGAVGVEGEINNHWMKRIGAAFLLSMVQDVIEARTRDEGGGGTVINTNTTSKTMAEKVLESTINIPPTLTRSRGERLMILVNRDLWFDSVYTIAKRP